MAEIYCKQCAEPWDSTGGLHWSHTDLDAYEHERLIRGIGCPCCPGKIAVCAPITDEERAIMAEQWERSIIALSEGQLFSMDAVDLEELAVLCGWEHDRIDTSKGLLRKAIRKREES